VQRYIEGAYVECGVCSFAFFIKITQQKGIVLCDLLEVGKYKGCRYGRDRLFRNRGVESISAIGKYRRGKREENFLQSFEIK